jgi:hypothetical protein
VVRLVQGEPVCFKCNHPEDAAPLPAVVHRGAKFVPPEALLPVVCPLRFPFFLQG